MPTLTHSWLAYRKYTLIALILSAACLSGCATGPGADPRDPLEPANRAVFGFNQKLDTAIVRPLAEKYSAHIPEPVQHCVSNIFSNCGDILTSVNQLLQGQVEQAANDISRFAVNTTIGVLGCFDPATDMGLAKHKSDFGATLAVWGVPAGPFVMLPLLGPSTVCEAAGLIPASGLDPVSRIGSFPQQLAIDGVRALSKRASLLEASDLFDAAALDPYLFLRDAYLSARQTKTHQPEGEAPNNVP